MRNSTAVLLSIAFLLIFPAAAWASDLIRGDNYIGIYGQAIGSPESFNPINTQALAQSFRTKNLVHGGNASGGVGVVLSGLTRDNVLLHLGFNYGFSPTISQVTSSGGHSLAFNARLGKGFNLERGLVIGPYLGYQYAQFNLDYDHGPYTAEESYNNNAIGGGLFVAAEPLRDVTLSAHAGYLVGISETNRFHVSNLSVTSGRALSASVLQVGGKISYRFLPDLSAFVGMDYDRYMAGKHYGPVDVRTRLNVLRGLVGLAYNF
ncbi:hypothetical protein AB4090_14005 [Acidithiobacillus sp. IBUN Pt1247-S3]